MDVSTLSQVKAFIVYIATTAPYAVPFWAAVIWVTLLFTRHTYIRFLWRKLLKIDDQVLETEVFSKIDVPVQVFLFLLAAMPLMGFIPGKYGDSMTKIAGFIAALLAVHVLILGADLIVFRWYISKLKNKTMPSVIRAMILGAIYTGCILVLLDWSFQINVIPLLATSTVATAVLGLALQDTLKNLFAGLTMMMENRFREGDWVTFLDVDNTSAVGQISEIGWRTVKLKTKDSHYAVVPNAQFTSTQHIIYNAGTVDGPARSIDFPINTKADVRQVVTCLEEAAKATKGVAEEPQPGAVLAQVGKDFVVVRLNFAVKEFAKTDTIAGEIMERGLRRLTNLGAVPASQ